MKTMKKDSKVRRVKEAHVSKFLMIGWIFCPKQVWKDAGRPKDVLAYGKEDL
jgi:hypothetical protein